MDADSAAKARGDRTPERAPVRPFRELGKLPLGLAAWWRFGRLGEKAPLVEGHHNSNFLLAWDDSLSRLVGMEAPDPPVAKLRVPLPGPSVVMRTWRDEARVLNAVRRHVEEVPHCLAELGRISLHTFEQGAPLSQVAAQGTAVGDTMLRSIAGVLARTALTRLDDLPPLPAAWPGDKDTDGFLRHLAWFAQENVYRRHRPEYGSLFDALGMPQDAMDRFLRRSRPLRARPFALLHTDLHRDNLVVRADSSSSPLFVLDWELATWGDPLHELATHLVRMGYTEDESRRMPNLWAEALAARGLSAMTDGLEADLPAYIAFEYAQSAYADIVRAAYGLADRTGEPSDVEVKEAVLKVGFALQRASEPIGLAASCCDDDRIEAALRAWHAERGSRGLRRLARRGPALFPEPVTGGHAQVTARTDRTRSLTASLKHN
jgi:aminoglycoside phosphotransferase (APT) family kinase protein